MGLLTDFFLADPAEVASLSAGTIDLERFPVLQSKGIDSIKVETLMETLGLDAEPLEPLGAGSEEDEAWLFLLPQPLVDALSTLDAGAISKVAGKWIRTDEFRPVVPGDVEALSGFLGELAALAREAKKSGKAMLLWVCL